MRRKWFFITSIIAVAVFNGCSNSDMNPETAKLNFNLTDAPGDFQEVNIDVQSINIILDDSIIELETNQGIYNLLEFVNGKDTLLVSDEIPGGHLSQVRLVLGENNSVMVDSVVYDIKTPSAQQSGLKLNVQYDFIPGIEYEFTIDFDAGKSIVKTGNGKYILKPVIHVFTEAVTGSIAGVVMPLDTKPLVQAIGMEDTTSTFTDTLTGSFMLRGLLPGAYQLDVLPEGEYSDTTLSDIQVVEGQVVVLDTLWLN